MIYRQKREMKEYTCTGCGVKFVRKESIYTTIGSVYHNIECARKHHRPNKRQFYDID